MKTIVVTGATSGIGFEVCNVLASHGHRVIGAARTKESGERAAEAIRAANPEADIQYVAGDLSRQSEINRMSDEIAGLLDTNGLGLDALINNAGCVRSWYSTTEDGFEQQFALNHLAAFLLTNRLLPLLKKSGGRVIMTGSGSHKMMKMRWDDLMFSKRYSPLGAYKQSKLCNMLFAHELNARLSADGIRAYVVDPGLVNTDIGNKQTGGIVNFVWSLRKKYGVSPIVPAMTYAYLCETRPAPDGLYYHLCQKKPYSKEVNDENARKLFEISQEYTGVDFGGAL